MDINQFIELVSSGFDVSFNHCDVFYTISLIKDNKEEGRIYGIGGDDGFVADFPSLESIPEFNLNGTTIAEIVKSLPEDEIFY